MTQLNTSHLGRLSPRRRHKQGTVIVIVLGLLVVLALIGIAFQYLVMNDYRAAKNWQTRYRANSVAQDGIAVATSRLRVIPTVQHWEGEGAWAYMSRREDDETLNSYVRISPEGDGNTPMPLASEGGVNELEREFYGQFYFPNVRLGKGDENNRVSYSLRSPRGTNVEKVQDLNWVDADGDGSRSNDETNLGRDLEAQEGDPLRQISYFAGDGIDLSMRAPAIRSGTFRELGDRARLKIVDTNAQLSINDYNGAQLEYMLRVLGAEIENLLDGSGQVDSTAELNPFTQEVVEEIVNLKESRVSRRIENKDEIERIMRSNLGESYEPKVFDFAMEFIALTSWPLLGSGQGQILRYDIARNPEIEKPMASSVNAQDWLDANAGGVPTKASDMRAYYPLVRGKFEGTAEESGNSIDGLPGILPPVSRISRSPFNVNTVSLPVLTALIAGIEAEARFILLPKKGLTQGEVFHNDTFTNYQVTQKIPTDLGRQPFTNSARPTDSQHNHLLFDMANDPQEIGSLSAYQNIIVGPFGYQPPTAGDSFTPAWKRQNALVAPGVMNPVNNSGSEARRLAQLIIYERDRNGPFLSWMDFDYRVCHQRLLAFGETQVGGGDDSSPNSPAAFPDLINLKRQAWDGNAASQTPASATSYLPDPEALISTHPATRIENTSAEFTYTDGTFKAWYYRAAVDMLRANFNPNGYYNKRNPDSAMYTTVDVTDLRYQTAPICFSTMGVYEVTSQGEIAALRPDPKTGSLRDFAVARRTYRGIVETYRTLEHTTQSDFLSAHLGQGDQASVYHSIKGTMTGPSSIDLSGYDYEEKIDTRHYRRRSLPYDNKKTQPGGEVSQRKYNLDGYYSISSADDERGYVSLHPQDRTPVDFMQLNEGGLQKGRLNFYAPFNTSLEARDRDNASTGVIPAQGGQRVIHTGVGPDATNASEEAGGIVRDAFNEDRGNVHPFGHLPVSRSGRNIISGMWTGDVEDAKQDMGMRYLWSATTSVFPDPLAVDFVASPEDGWGGFENMANRGNSYSARYANLRPDGIMLRGWDLSPAFFPKDDKNFEGSHVRRIGVGPAVISGGQNYAKGPYAVSRLAILRYRCGGTSDHTPFSPIAGVQPDVNSVLYTPSDLTNDPATDEAALMNIVQRGYGEQSDWEANPARGLDQHNIDFQDSRQFDTNFPYYQGWIDFWIKWELPPQGGSQQIGEVPTLVSAGEIDPGSANFSGLLGATQFGRFSENLTEASGDGVIWRDLESSPTDLDFEGASFFLFKESGGVLRISQSYFTWAHHAKIPVQGVSSGGGQQSSIIVRDTNALITEPIGNDYRIKGKPTGADPDDPSSGDLTIQGSYIYTNDIASGDGDYGFSKARTESRVDLSPLVSRVDDGQTLVPHNWYRFTVGYVSNAEAAAAAHTVYIDGRKLPVQTLVKNAWSSGSTIGTGLNTGEVVDKSGMPVPFSVDTFGDENSDFEYYVQRSSSKSVEVDPEDRLTIGCIFRRQHGPSMDAALNNDVTKSPLFYLDRNLVAVANATIDDVRISADGPDRIEDQLYSEAEYEQFSRYHRVTTPREEPLSAGTDINSMGWEELGRYENGFVAVQPAVEFKARGGKVEIFEAPYALPVQVGSITWTEYRPWWDSYRRRRVDLSDTTWSKAPYVTLTYEVFDTVNDAVKKAGRLAGTNALQRMTSVSRAARNHWLAGGYALARVGVNEPVLLSNRGVIDADEVGGSPFFKYQAHFLVDEEGSGAAGPWGVLNSTPILDDVRITLMTPARLLTMEVIDE